MNRLQMKLIKRANSADLFAREQAARALATALETDVDPIARSSAAEALARAAQPEVAVSFQAWMNTELGNYHSIPSQVYSIVPFNALRGNATWKDDEATQVVIPEDGLYLLHFCFKNRARKADMRANLLVNDALSGILYRGVPEQLATVGGVLVRELPMGAVVGIELFTSNSAGMQIFRGDETQFSAFTVADQW